MVRSSNAPTSPVMTTADPGAPTGLVDQIRGSADRYTSGRVTVYLAREFGFCYGVDGVVDYAYRPV